MHDIQELESQWRRYKRRQILRPTIAFVSILVVGGALYYLLPLLSKTLSHRQEQVVPAADATAAPSPHNRNTTAPLGTEVASVTKPVAKKGGWKMTFAGEESAAQEPASSSTKHVDIEVQSRKSDYTVKEIEDRFRFAKDKDDALFLARYYYDKKQYKTALKWSLETNKLDSDIEESWLLFARSKAKLGQRKEAIRVLQAYYDRTGSPKSKKLLDRIRRGKAF